jgi:hypothetical protein
MDSFPAASWADPISSNGPGCYVTCASGRLYATPSTVNDAAMAWYDLDAKNGNPKLKGIVPCPAVWQAIVGPGQQDIYFKSGAQASQSRDSILWFRLDATGKPVYSGSVNGTGIAGIGWGGNYITLSPDSKFLYCISPVDYAVACIARNTTTGAITYVKSTSLTPALASHPYYTWNTLAISPDGKWLYVYEWDYGTVDKNFVAIYKRDLSTGDITYQETITGDVDAVASRKDAGLVFFPDNSGFLAGMGMGLTYFEINPANGHLENTVEASDVASTHISIIDSAKGFLYGWSGSEHYTPGIFTFKCDPFALAAVEQPRAQVKAGSFALSGNPVMGAATVDALIFGYSGTGIVALHDLTGKVLRTADMSKGLARLKLSGLANGVYLVSAITQKGISYSTKLTLLK